MRQLLTITATVCILFGIGSILVPANISALYGNETDAVGLVWARFYGAAILAIGVLAYLARTLADLEAQRTVALTMLLLWSINLVLNVHGVMTGLINWLAWVSVALDAALALGYGIVWWSLRSRARS